MCTKSCCESIGECLKTIFKLAARVYMMMYVLLHFCVTVYTIVIGVMKGNGEFDGVTVNTGGTSEFEEYYIVPYIFTCVSVFSMNLYLILLFVKNLACVKNPEKYGCSFDRSITHNSIEGVRIGALTLN